MCVRSPNSGEILDRNLPVTGTNRWFRVQQCLRFVEAGYIHDVNTPSDLDAYTGLYTLTNAVIHLHQSHADMLKPFYGRCWGTTVTAASTLTSVLRPSQLRTSGQQTNGGQPGESGVPRTTQRRRYRRQVLHPTHPIEQLAIRGTWSGGQNLTDWYAVGIKNNCDVRPESAGSGAVGHSQADQQWGDR